MPDNKIDFFNEPINDNEYAIQLSQDLRIIRSSLRLSQKAVAEHFEVSLRQYARWEMVGLKKIGLMFWLKLYDLIQECRRCANSFKECLISHTTVILLDAVSSRYVAQKIKRKDPGTQNTEWVYLSKPMTRFDFP